MRPSDGICKSVIIKVIIIDLILVAIFAIFTKEPLYSIYGLAFGSIFSMLNFRLLALTIEKAVKMEPSKAQAYAAGTYFVRYILTGVILVVAFKADYLNPLTVILGILLIKIVILIDNIFVKKNIKSSSD